MLYKTETGQGSISIGGNVIVRIIFEATAKLSGRAFLSNHKGKMIARKQRLGAFDLKDYCEMTMGTQGLDIRVFILIRFGTSIGAVTEQLIEYIKTDIEKMTGIEVNSIAIVVSGLLSKKISRRNIEIKG
jgi:uncharacterized alkaline shock family protein YloU